MSRKFEQALTGAGACDRLQDMRIFLFSGIVMRFALRPGLFPLAFCLVVFLVFPYSAPAASPGNPVPLDDDLVLPMPDGGVMALRPVCVSSGGYFAWKRFRMGDPNGGYKESPTGVALGGAFKVQGKGGEDWCYYLGKYEVTENQFQAVTGLHPEWKGSRYPVRNISWFEAQDFLRQYNQWLFEHAVTSLPLYGGMPGYLRLPTETEWEFAARGGNNVDGAHFDRKIPYPPEKLPDYEWFSGPSSSHNKVKKVGLLKANPLGLHDMLGNVAEMTRTLYQVEYYQGRSGGYVARGGHYLSDRKRLRSSLRSEQEFYAPDRRSKVPRPARKSTLGFRVALSSLVFPNRQVSRAMKEAWDPYRKGLGSTLPAAVSTSSTATQTSVSGTEAGRYLERLRKRLEESGALRGDVRQALDNLESSLGDIQFTIRQAARDSAYAWIKIAAEQAFFITRESRKLPILADLIESARQSGRERILKKYRQREEEIRLNISQALSSYTESIRQLGSSGREAYRDGLARYRSFLERRKAGSQLALLPTVDRHARSYLKLKRIDDEQWLRDLTRGQNRP